MQRLKKMAILWLIVVCCLGLAWMFLGGNPGEPLTNRANVASSVFGAVAVLLALYTIWPRSSHSTSSSLTEQQLATSADYLARETLVYWTEQARTRGVTTPAPAAVRWQWAGPEVAAPPRDVQGDGSRLFTRGEVTAMKQQLYERLPPDRARIVIIGGPGSGKTGAMLLLLIDTLSRRDSEAVPVWLTLGSWNPRKSLLKWAGETLSRDYPGLGSSGFSGSRVAAELLRTGKVSLFLDGLDEMPAARRRRALSSIDRESADLRVVMTSRPAEYKEALTGGRIYGAAVVETLPLEPDQARDFLLRDQLAAQRAAWDEVAAFIVRYPNSVAARTLTTPLALTLARDTFAQGPDDPRELLDEERYASPDALLRYLLARLLHHAYPSEKHREHTVRWLGWLARRMGTGRDLAWWRIPPGAAAIGGPRALGRVVSETGDRSARTSPERRRSSKVTRAGWEQMLVLRMRSMVVMTLFVFSIYGAQLIRLAGSSALSAAAPQTLSVSVVAGALFGRLLGASRNPWANGVEDSPAITPQDAYRSERQYAMLGGGMVAVGVGVVLGMLLGPRAGVLGGAFAGAAFAVGPTVALWVTQLILLLAHRRRVRFMPLLEDALTRQVLRQVGPVYQFRHAALQEYLASEGRRVWTPPDRNAASVGTRDSPFAP